MKVFLAFDWPKDYTPEQMERIRKARHVIGHIQYDADIDADNLLIDKLAANLNQMEYNLKAAKKANENKLHLDCFGYHVEEVPYNVNVITGMKYYMQDGANEPVWFMGLYKTADEALKALRDYIREKVAESKK